MARLISAATGNFTSASTWGVAEAGSGATNVTFTAGTTLGTSYTYSSAFTVTASDVIDAVSVFLYRTGSSGTVTLALSDDNGVTATREVTINVADLNPDTAAEGAWVTFKLGSTLTGDGGADYKVGLKASGFSLVGAWRSGVGNWVRQLRTTTTAAPAAGDILTIAKEWTGTGTGTAHTVTMNETATTAYGEIEIGLGGTLEWNTAAAANPLLRLAGTLTVRNGGTLNIGTSGTPIPRDSVAVLEFDCASDGQYYLNANGTVNIYGQSRTSGKDVYKCRLNTDEAAAQTVLGVDTDTGWLNGDTIAIASTTRTSTQLEEATLSGGAGASSITVTAGITNAHAGTAPAQAHVVLLTRNVRIRSTSSTNASKFVVNAQATVNVQWADFRYMGYGTSTNSCVFTSATTAPVFRYCVIRDSDGAAFYMSFGTVPLSVRDTVIYKMGTATHCFYIGTIAALTLQDVLVMGGGNASSYGFNLTNYNSTSSSISNLVVTSTVCSGAFFIASPYSAATLDGFEAYSNNSLALVLQSGLHRVTFSNFAFWRNNSYALNPSNVSHNGFVWSTGKFFGNHGTAHIMLSSSSYTSKWLFKNVNFAADSSFSVTYGVYFNPGSNFGYHSDWRFEGCVWGNDGGGIYADHTNDIGLVNNGETYFTGVVTGTSVINTPGNFTATYALQGAYIAMQGASSASVYTPYGTLAYETTTVDVSPSLKMTPTSATYKLTSNARISGRGWLVKANSGQVITPSVKVQKDGSYNGAAPRLVVKANPAVGITADTVLDTHSIGSGSFETLSGATAALSADGVLEFIVDCDGTAGNIYVDTFTVTVA